MAQAFVVPPNDLITPPDDLVVVPPPDLIRPPSDLLPAQPTAPSDPYGTQRMTALGGIGNLGLGVAERATQLLGGGLALLGTPVDAVADYLERALPLGTVDVSAAGIKWRPNTEAELQANPFSGLSKGAKFGYTPMTTWEDVKAAPLSSFIPFAFEQGIVSLPDMAAVMTTLPYYIAARTGEIGEQRAANDERAQATVGDFIAAAPAAVASALLERLGTSKILGVDEAVKAFKEIPKASGKAFVTEAGTEAGQEAVEYLGEQAGTKKGVSFSEGAERALAAAVGGGPFGAGVRGGIGAVEAFQNWRSGRSGPTPPPDIDPTQEELNAFANSPEAQRAAANVRRYQAGTDEGPPPDQGPPPPPPPAGGAPRPGEAIGLRFPNAPSRRATVEQYFDGGDSVRVIFDNGEKADFLTEEVLRDRTEAPPPMGESVRGREASEGALSEAEAAALFDEVPDQPSTRQKVPQQPRLAPEAINALDQAKELERIALSNRDLPTAQRTAMLTQAAELRQRYGAPAEPAAEPARAVPAPTELATKLGPLGAMARPQQETVRLYRGEKPGERPTSAGSAATGGWFTTDPERAKTFGDVYYVDVTRDELKNFASGAGRPDTDLVTTDPSFRQRMRPLNAGSATDALQPRFPGEPVPRTTPEPLEDIAAQIEALLAPRGPRDSVFIAAGTQGMIPADLPSAVMQVARPEGTLLTIDRGKARMFENAPELQDDLMAEILNYPTSKREAVMRPDAFVIQARDPDGRVLYEAATVPEKEALTTSIAQRYAGPTGSVERLSAEEAQARRAAITGAIAQPRGVQGEAGLEQARTVQKAKEAQAPQIIRERRAEARGGPRIIRRADLIDPDGTVDMGKAGQTLAQAAEQALQAGNTVTLYQEGKAIPITSVIRGMIADAKGQRWGAMGILAPRRGDDDRLEITPRAPQAQTVRETAPQVPAQENVSGRSAEATPEDTAPSRVQTPGITREQAKEALRRNIDPRTGKPPQGGKAGLRTFRQQMKSIMTGKPIAKRAPRTYTSSLSKELSALENIRAMGGVSIWDSKGRVTSEGADLREILGPSPSWYRKNGGKSAEDLLRMFRDDGWFRGAQDKGAGMRNLFELFEKERREGKQFHPESDRAKTEAAAQEERENERYEDPMERLRFRARELNIQYPSDATEEELDAAITEREAMLEDNLDPIADEREAEVQAKFAELRKLYDPLEAWSRVNVDASTAEVSGEPEAAEVAAVEPARAEPAPRSEEEPTGPDKEAGSRREDEVPVAGEEPGALDEETGQRVGLPQKIIPGAEQSVERSNAVRESALRTRQKQELELRAKQQKMRRGNQQGAGGMFAPERDQTDIFAPGSKQAPVTIETKADLKTMNTAPINENPSKEQIDAQNGKLVHVVYQGLPISLEQRKGDIRRSKDPKRPWEVKMPFAYGYFKKSDGYDGDEVDVFIGDNPDSKTAFIIFQKDLETGKFDEHKVMLGFDSVTQARQGYIDSFSDGKGMQRIINIQQLSVDNLKKRLEGGFFTTKPRAVDLKRESKEGFRRLITRRLTVQQKRLATAKRLFERDGRVTATYDKRPDLRYVLTRSTDPGVAFRVTTIDKDGPSGHRNYNTFDDAVNQEFMGDKTFQNVGEKPQYQTIGVKQVPNRGNGWVVTFDGRVPGDSRAYRTEAQAREEVERLISQGQGLRVRESEAPPAEATNVSRETSSPEFFGLESFNAAEEKLRKGDMTAAEAMENFERVIANETSLKQALSEMTKDQLAKLDPRNRNEKKSVLVDSIYRDMQNAFNASGVYSWVMGKGGHLDGIRKAMEKQTDADIKEAAEKRKARGKELVQTYTDPQTLAQFEQFIRVRGRDKLTDAQRERYDSLVADQTKNDQARERAAAAIVKKVDADATMSDIIETKHTQKGHDLFVVQLSDRVPKDQYTALASAAKKLGGYYSSYRKEGAVPGFQFKTREAAEKFRQLREGDVSKQDIVEKRAEEVKDNSVNRLRDMADNMEAAADDSLNADRKTNTARRARMAASAELDAAQNKALAITMRNIADAIEDGDVRYLDRIRTKADIEHLEKLVRNARTEWAMAQRDKTGERFEELTSRPITREMIDSVKFPHPYTHRETLAKLGRYFAQRPGMKRMAAEAIKIAADLERRDIWRFNAESLADQEMLQVLAKAGLKDPDLKYESDNILETFTDNARITNMGFQNLPTLRAALREFLEHRGNAPKQDPIKVAKRALIGMKIAGYFPTPPKVVDRLMELADVREGQKVLEPSAGTGNIADRLRDTKADVETIETVPTLANILKMKGHNIVGGDFMEHTDGDYDRIVMNPPFEKGQDIDHVRHAYDLLKPGGKLVAVMSEGPFGRSDAKAEGFRQWLDAVGGTSERLPQGSFLDSDRSTGVATRIVTILKRATSAVTDFLKSESGMIPDPTRRWRRRPPPVDADMNDDVADAIAEDTRGTPIGTYARAAARTQAGQGATAVLGWLPRHFIEPRALARKDFRSAAYWNAIKAEDHEGSANISSYRELLRPYLELKPESRKRVDAVLELDRLENRTRRDDGRRVVARNENQDEAELSRPGQSIRLTRPETDALHAARRMFAKQWSDLIRGTAIKFGWNGEPSSAVIRREAEGMSEREAKPLLRIADLLQALEQQERAGYVPLMRHGDYYIAVKRTGDEDSLGGFPRVARFERVETSPGWEQLFGNVPGLSSRTRDGVPKAVAKRLAELERKYPRAEGFEIEHGDVSRNLDALRSLDIPAIEKFLMAIESRDGGLYSPLVEEARDRLYEELKAGFKKRSRTVPGYSADFSRSIGSYSHWIAYHVAQLIHGERVQRAYDETQKHPNRNVREFWQKWKQDDDAPLSVGDKFARGMTVAAFYYTMAANPSSAIVTFDAPLAARAVLSVGIGGGATRGPFLQSLKDGVAALRANTKEGIHVDIMSLARNDAERAFLKQLLEQGELGRTQELATDFGKLSDHQAEIFGEYRSQAKKALDISTSAFLSANEMSRAVTALTAFRLAGNVENFEKMDSAWSRNEVYRDMKARYGASRETLARFLTTEAAFEWGRKNRAEWLGRHALGSVVWQFKQFPLKFLSVVKNLMTEMGAPGKAAAGLLLVSLWAYAGAQGLPFVQDAEKLLDWLTQQLTGEDPQIRASIYRLLDKAGLGKVGADVVMRGPLSVFFGADVSNRFGFGDLVSQNQSAVDFMGAAPSMFYQALAGAQRRYSSGQSPLAVVAQAAPAAIRNPLQGFGVYPDEGAKTQAGSTLVRPEEFSVGDQVARAVGFQPLKVSRAYDRMEHERRTRDASDLRVSRVYSQLATLIQQQNEAKLAKNGAAVMRIGKQISDLANANRELGLTPRNVRMRVLQRENPSAAALKIAPRRAREEMLDNPFPPP